MRAHFLPTVIAFILLQIPCFIFSQTPDLGAAAPFALFTASGAFNGDAGSSVVGDIGTNIGAFTPPGTLVGQIHVADPISAQAAADVSIAYGYLSTLTCGGVLGVTLGNGQLLTPNIYCTGAASTLNGALTLDGLGDPNALFIFQIDGAFATNVNSTVTLINGASLCNVYWQVNGQVDLGENSTFQGTIVNEGAINLLTGARLSGRGLSTAGAISTSANIVQLSSACFCALSITCPPAAAPFQCIDDIPAGVATDITINTSCGATSTAITETSTGTGCVGNPFTLLRTFTVTDLYGRTASCVVTLTAIDNTAPTVVCPGPITVQCADEVPLPNTAAITTTDNCSQATVTFDGAVTTNQTCTNRFNQTQTYTATDACGNTATCAQTITVFDNIAPVLSTPPANATVTCDAVPPPATLTATDNCDDVATVVFSTSTLPGACANSFSLLRVWTSTDACGNAASVSQTVVVSDNIPPVITCPIDATVSCLDLLPLDASATIVTNDNCNGAVTVTLLSGVITGQVCPNLFVTRIYQAVDICGNVATCAQIITVNDQIAPTITCPVDVMVNCLSQVPANASGVIPTSDNCGGVVSVSLSDAISGQTCPNNFSIVRSYQATDPCGNTAICIQNIVVNDQVAPVITCPVNVVVSCASNVPAPAPAAIVTADACGGAVNVALLSDIITNQTCANRFTVNRTYQATDLCGNSALCVQSILVNDLSAPVITCPVNVVVSCASNVPAPAPAAIVTADACGGAVNVVLLSDIITNQICANRFTVTRTYQATDLCGNVAACAQIITVLDNTAPVFINPPANVTVECLLVPAVPTNLTATDNCTGAVTVSLLSEIQIPGLCPIVYTLNRTWVATDACGNTATALQIVTVLDNSAPQFSSFPLDVMLECDVLTNLDAYQDWLDSHGGAIVFDCSVITWTFINSPFNLDTAACAASFNHYIRFIATDACGNSTFHDARFIVSDQTPPTFSVLPLNLEIDCGWEEEGIVALSNWIENFGYAVVSDGCGNVTTEVAFLSEIQGCGNTYKRNYQFRATDECGNTNYLNATYSVIDTTPPVITVCPPSNMMLVCEFDIPAPDTAGVEAFDYCGLVNVTLQSTYSYGVGCLYSPLSKSYTYAVTDECGNVSTCQQSFYVVDSIPPTYTGLDTIAIACFSDLPEFGEISGVLSPFFVDLCYDIICISDGVPIIDSNTVTYCVTAKDLCANWTDHLMITFIATGDCKPLCTASQNIWGDELGVINGITTTEIIETLIGEYGGVSVGTLGKTITVTSTQCLQDLLPGHGSTANFAQGTFEFNEANNCAPSATLVNGDGTLRNQVAANALALQLNIWYNLSYNDRDLGIQQLSTLPLCLIDPIVFQEVQPDLTTVQGLLNMSNLYLGNIGGFQPAFGVLLNNSLERLNRFWENCQINDPCTTNVSVAGNFKTEAQDGLEFGHIALEGSHLGSTLPGLFEASDAKGQFEFSKALPIASNYSLLPNSANMAYTNGVTTYDLVLISKHILGIEPLNSPYKMIAADANNSGSITSFDILELRKLILGVYETLPGTASWRFVDNAFVFPNLDNPFVTTFPESKTLLSIQSNEMANDFVAVKIGDVNGSAMANSLMGILERNTATMLFDLEERQVTTGETFEVKMTADQLVQGYQFTLNMDGLEVLEIVGQDMNRSNFAVFNADNALTVSWDSPEATVSSLSSFALTFRATKAGKLSEMLSMSSRITPAVAYGKSTGVAYHPLEVALRFNAPAGTTVSGVGFELYQNIPNPFVTQTLIGFHLPEAASATLRVYDEVGKLVHEQQGDFAKGYNAFAIDANLVISQGTGILYYNLETAKYTATRKMIQAK